MASVAPAGVSLLEVDGPDAVSASTSDKSEKHVRRTSIWADGAAVFQRDSHRVPASQYFALFVWFSVLAFGYAWTRLWCSYGVPPDCKRGRGGLELMNDANTLILQGLLLALLTGMYWPDRFQYVFGFFKRLHRGPVFVGIMAMSGTIWGALSLVPGLSSFTLTAGGIQGWHIMLLIALILLTVFLVLWHIRRALIYNSWFGFASYMLARVALFGFYVLYGIVAAKESEVVFHLHHYAVGLLIASLAEFNHPLSVLLLAIGLGIFVQGIAAYDADAIISVKSTHLVFTNGVRSPVMSEDAYDFVVEKCKRWEL